MPTPSGALATLRPDLGGSLLEFDLKAQANRFIATKVLPVIESTKASGTYGLVPLEQLSQDVDTSRSGGTGYARGGFTFDDAAFACVEHGYEVKVDDRDAALYSDYFDAELIAADLARDKPLRNLEKRVSAAVFNTTTWTGSSLYTDIANVWSTVASSTPIQDVAAAMKKVYDNSGFEPNALIISYANYLYLRQSAEVQDQLGSDGAGTSFAFGEVNAQALARVFGLDHVLVGSAIKNSANEGLAASNAAIWSNSYAMVARIGTTSNIKEPCIGNIIHWGQDGSQIGCAMESYDEIAMRGSIVRARMDVDEIIKYPEMGHLIKVD